MSVENNTEKIATRALIVVDDKILLGKRARGICAGKYALIGGKLDDGEAPEETVVRETKEETGLSFNDAVLWKEESNDKTIPGQVWHTYYYLGKVVGTINLKKDEVEKVVYVGRRDLHKIDIAFNHKEILEEFFGLR